jgi:hypothetical protein
MTLQLWLIMTIASFWLEPAKMLKLVPEPFKDVRENRDAIGSFKPKTGTLTLQFYVGRAPGSFPFVPPQVAENNTPRSMDVAGECLL